jgi:hypothetical protein
MIQSSNNLEVATQILGYQPGDSAWESLQEKIVENAMFWSAIRALSAPGPMDKADPHRKKRSMKAYLGVDRLSTRDWLFLSQEFFALLDKSRSCEDLDECVRMVRDFMRLEEGKPIDRQISVSNLPSLRKKSVLELFEELPDYYADRVANEEGFGLDYGAAPSRFWIAYQSHLFAQMDDIEKFASQFPSWTPRSSVKNLITCIRAVLTRMDDFNEGVDEAINLLIRYLQQRRNMD